MIEDHIHQYIKRREREARGPKIFVRGLFIILTVTCLISFLGGLQ